jgi:hypothetical protein
MAIAANDDRQYLEVGRLDSTTHYVLNYGDIDTSDVVLDRIFREGLKIGVPWDVVHNPKSERPLSKEVTSSSLQSFINRQFGRDSKRHREMTQFREIRDHDFLEGKFFKNYRDAFKNWIYDGHCHAAEFDSEYRRTYGEFRLLTT